MAGFEEPDFLIDVGTLAGGGRADDNQRTARIKCDLSWVRERMARREIVTIAEDRPE